jgi:AcrR family transcriptional regulator
LNTKESIVKTALELFLQDGFERTSLNRLAREVGISKPAIYHYFRNKDELFHEVVSMFFREMGKWSSNRFASCETLEDLLRAFFDSLESFREVADILLGKKKRGGSPYSFLELLLNASKRDARVRARIEEVFLLTRRALRERLTEAQARGEIRTDVDPEMLALQIHALIEGMTLISRLDGSIDLDTIGERIFKDIWTMIRT